MVAMETELACDLRYLLSGPSLANSITNMIGSSTQIPNKKKYITQALTFMANLTNADSHIQTNSTKCPICKGAYNHIHC